MELRYVDTPFVKFVLSGILSTISQFLTLVFCVEGLGLPETFSSGIAFSISAIVNYLLLYFWAFQSNGKHHIVFPKFTAIAIIGLLLNVALFWVLNVAFGIWYLLSQIITTGSIVIINYFVKRKYVF